MNRHFLRFGCAALMMCVLITSCKKADVVATATDPQLTFAVTPDAPLFTFAGTGKQTFVWSAGTANVTRFRFNAKKGDVAVEYSSASLNNVDVFNASTLVSSISIPKGDFSAIKTSIVFSQTTAAPFPLVLTGSYTTSSGSVIPTEFDLNDAVEIGVYLNPGNTVIAADGTKDFSISIATHLSALLNGIAAADMDAAVKTNGIILISKTVNIPLYTKIKANMVSCSGSVLTSKSK